MTSVLAAAVLAPPVLTLTGSCYGPSVDRHFSPRVAYRSRRIADEPDYSCACNRFPLGVWLIAEWHGRRVRVWNNDRSARRWSGRIDLLIGPWKELSGGARPGLLKGVRVWADSGDPKRKVFTFSRTDTAATEGQGFDGM